MFRRKKTVLAAVLLYAAVISVSAYPDRAGLVYATEGASEDADAPGGGMSADGGTSAEFTVSGGDMGRTEDTGEPGDGQAENTDQTAKEPEYGEGTGQEDHSAVSGGDAGINTEDSARKEDGGTVSGGEMFQTAPMEITVPIYNNDIVDVVVPTSYAVALNPYGMAVRTGEESVSAAQVVSRNYGIVNKSTSDKIVTVTLTVEDLNGGRITFVPTAEAALHADKDTFALYLAVVPADGSGVGIGDGEVDKDTVAGLLSDVTMAGAKGKEVPLYAGTNSVAFRLSKADYRFGDGGEAVPDSAAENAGKMPELTGLAPDGKGVTAFTFDGAMNPDADWEELARGIRISVIYSYGTAGRDVTVIPGTGAMVDLHTIE